MPPAACHAARGARPQPACELADVLRRHGPAYRHAHRLPRAHRRVMDAIESCRTAALGGHRESCARCSFERYAYNSCRNRHCPKCGSLARAQWLEERQADLLPVPYFHNVFTLPHQLNALILCHDQNRRALLNLLFRSAAATLLAFGRKNLGGQLGVTMVLHTWDQQLRAHFHVHCLIAGGALSPDGQHWREAHPRFLFSVRALSKVFRAKFLDGLRQLHHDEQLRFPGQVAHLAGADAFETLLQQLGSQGWVVYCQPPFAGPAKLLDYLGRYTRRVALCNGRLLSMDDGRIRFHYRDRAHGNCPKVATLAAAEFIRRFLLHVLPAGFQRIRHYGLLASRNKEDALARCRQLLDVADPAPPEKKSTTDWLLRLTGMDITRCPQCGHQPLQRDKLPPLRCVTAVAGLSPEPPIKDTS